MSLSIHGGDIYRNKVSLDFSVNTNPLGMPDSVRQALYRAAEECGRYPDIRAEHLTQEIASRDQVDKSFLLCGNGASELLLAVVHAIRPRETLIPVPSFFGYEKAAMGGRGKILFYEMKKEYQYQLDFGVLSLLSETIDLLFLANPNNPVGNLLEDSLLFSLLEICKEKGIYVVLDECFLEFTRDAGQESMLGKLEDYPNLVVIRAFTKIYGIPGVRLGYLASSGQDLLENIKKQLPEWNVSTFAQMAGAAACREKEYVELTRAYVEEERSYLSKGLEELGIKVFPSQANFLLIFTETELYEALLEREILIRSCKNFIGLDRGYYRIGIRSHKENKVFLKAVRDICRERRKMGKGVEFHMIEPIQPEEIEKRSFEIIDRELREQGIRLEARQEAVIKRVIHTSADFDYASTLAFSHKAVEKAVRLLKQGADIVTDTNMALAGINKKVLARYGGEAHCFMAEEKVEKIARERKVTRASVSMEFAAQISKPVLFAIGNAPTALIRLHELMQESLWKPAFIIGVPVGFVQVEAAKKLILESEVPYIVNRGRKGGSNIAAAICNALLYGL